MQVQNNNQQSINYAPMQTIQESPDAIRSSSYNNVTKYIIFDNTRYKNGTLLTTTCYSFTYLMKTTNKMNGTLKSN